MVEHCHLIGCAVSRCYAACVFLMEAGDYIESVRRTRF